MYIVHIAALPAEPPLPPHMYALRWRLFLGTLVEHEVFCDALFDYVEPWLLDTRLE